MNEKIIIQKIADEVERTGIDIAPTVDTFKSLVYAIANIYRDDTAAGSEILHRLCENYPNYNKASVSNWYTSAVKHCRGNVRINTVIKLTMDAARMANVSITIPTSNFPTQTENKKRVNNEYMPKYNYLDAKKIIQYAANNHVLYVYLNNLFGNAKTRAAMQLYYIGGTYDGKTIFPNANEKRMFVGGVVIPYQTNGHRDKTRVITTIHALFRMRQGDQVLFGSHLLPMYSKAYVGIVEAQKTAIILSIVMPTNKYDIIWLATGGKGNFNDRFLKPIYNRKVIVFPDADGVEEWTERTKQLPFSNVVVSSWYADEPRGSHRDIADKIIDAMNEKSKNIEKLIIQLFPNNNDAVITLCRLFDLQIVNDTDTGTGWKWDVNTKHSSWLDRIKHT